VLLKWPYNELTALKLDIVFIKLYLLKNNKSTVLLNLHSTTNVLIECAKLVVFAVLFPIFKL
jgi:hypothetical protein